MILIGLGANLPSPRFGTPRDTCEAALGALEARGLGITTRSRWYESAPVPVSDQPWFVNGVAAVETRLDPAAVMDILHRVEDDFGRVRVERNEARVLDLDLLDYAGKVRAGGPVLPHPRMHERAFVLLPLRDIAPDWRHPVTGEGLDALIRALPVGQECRPAIEQT